MNGNNYVTWEALEKRLAQLVDDKLLTKEEFFEKMDGYMKDIREQIRNSNGNNPDINATKKGSNLDNGTKDRIIYILLAALLTLAGVSTVLEIVRETL